MQQRQAGRRRVVIIVGIAVLVLVAAAVIVFVARRSSDSAQPVTPRPCPDLSAVPCVSDAPALTVPLAGGRVRLSYAGDRLDGGAIQQSTWNGWTFAERHTYLPEQKLLLLGTGTTRSVPSVSRTSAGKQTLLVGAADGREVYEFDQRGRQLRTVDGLTGAALLNFGYDERGRLTSVDAAAGHKVVLDYRSDSAVPSGITVDKVDMNLVSEPDGRLIAVTDADGATWRFGYTNDGRLAEVTDPAEALTRYEYRGSTLTKVRTPGGGSLSYDNAGPALTITADTGDRIEYRSERDGDGTIHRRYKRTGTGSATETIKPDGTRRVEAGDGHVLELSTTDDPRLGASVPVMATRRVSWPGKASLDSRLERTVELADKADPLSLRKLHEQTVGGRDAGTWDYDAGNRTLTGTSPAGRVTTTKFDERGRMVSRQRPGTPATVYGYDRGVSTSIGVGDRTVSFAYEEDSGTLTTQDPMGTSTTVINDVGRVVQRSVGDGPAITIDYDPAGRPVAVTPPGRAQHVYAWQPNGSRADYAPPVDAGGPIEDVHTPTDSLGRPASLSIGGERQYEISYAGNGSISFKGKDFGLSVERGESGQISSAAMAGGVKVDFGYVGDRMVEQKLSGPIQASLSATYADTGRLAALRAGPDATVELGHDPDGELTKFGPVTFERDKGSGRIQRYTVGSVAVSVEYDQYGQPVKRTVAGGHGEIGSLAFTRDGAGRVTKITERGRAGNRSESFGFDGQRRLTGVAYDATGNPAVIGGQPASYDARDRLRALGSATLDYDRAGRLTSIADGGKTSGYGWDPLGRLTSATPAGGPKISYLVDAEGRRVGKQVDGKTVTGWLYLDALKPVAELDGSGKVVATFAYDDSSELVGMTRDGKQYAIVTDHRGSPVLVVDAASGEVAQRMAYDAAGNVVANTKPGLQPFGLAGGLYDQDTKLVHFGAREYSPALGRWLSIDPKGFDAGDANLYRYAQGDPVNNTDRTGLSVDTLGICVGGSIAVGLGYAGGVCFQTFSDYSDYKTPWFAYFGPQVGADFGLSVTGNYGVSDVDGRGADLFSGASSDVGYGFGSAAFGSYEPLPGNHGFSGYYAGFSVGAPGGYHKGTYTYAAFGEPHFLTPRGIYDFMGVGEYVLATDGSDTFQVQVRQRPIPENRAPASMVTAVAATVDGDRVGLYRRGTETQALVGGKPVTAGPRAVALPHGGSVRLVGSAWLITWKDGTVVEVAGDGPAQYVSMSISAARRAKLTGLLGTADGKLVKPDGKEVPTPEWPPSFAAVHKDFGPAWRVTQDKSLFDYGPGESADGFYDPNFATAPVDVSKLPADARAAAERLCGPLRDKGDQQAFAMCVLDVAATGHAGFAATAARVNATVLPPDLAKRPEVPTSPTSAPPVQPGGTVADGATVVGQITKPGEGIGYDLVLTDATQFSLVGVQGNVDFRLVDHELEKVVTLPGPYQYAVDKPGKYRMEVSLNESATGPYSFRFIARPLRQLTANVGDKISGRLDVPGRVDVYKVDMGSVRNIRIADGKPCEDIETGFSTNQDPAVRTPGRLCWDMESHEQDGPVSIVVWSENGKPADYSFRIEEVK